MNLDPRVDAYIARSAAFAQPLLSALRKAMHASHSGVNETIKWGMPFFVQGNKPLAHMAAFKQHCAFGFWRGKQVVNGTGQDAKLEIPELPSHPRGGHVKSYFLTALDPSSSPTCGARPMKGDISWSSKAAGTGSSVP